MADATVNTRGAPYDVIALETRNRANERLIAHLNTQVPHIQIVIFIKNIHSFLRDPFLPFNTFFTCLKLTCNISIFASNII